jgi:hypothetical protein
MKNFDANNNITTGNGLHKARSQENDLRIVVKQLQDNKVFDPNLKNINESFRHMSTNLIRTLDETKVKDWMIDHVAELMN